MAKKKNKKNYGWPKIKQFTIEEIEQLNKKGKIKSVRIKHLLKSGYNCAHCGKKGSYFAHTLDPAGGIHLDLFAEDDTLMTIDHILPKSLGGKDIQENIQTLCNICNGVKSATIGKKDLEIVLSMFDLNKEEIYINIFRKLFDNDLIDIEIFNHILNKVESEITKAKKYYFNDIRKKLKQQILNTKKTIDLKS